MVPIRSSEEKQKNNESMMNLPMPVVLERGTVARYRKEVEKIVDERVVNGITEFRVKWIDWPHLDNAWISEDSIMRSYGDDLIMKFRETRSQVPKENIECNWARQYAYDKEYTVESIVSRRVKDDKIEYCVRWKNFSSKRNSWEPLQNIINHLDLVKAYEDSELQKTKLAEVRPIAGFFDQGWKVETVTGIIDNLTDKDDTKYRVKIRHRQTGDSMEKVLTARECGREKGRLLSLVKGLRSLKNP